MTSKKKTQLYIPLARVHYKAGTPEARYIDPADPPESGEKVDLDHLTEIDRIILIKRGIYQEVK